MGWTLWWVVSALIRLQDRENTKGSTLLMERFGSQIEPCLGFDGKTLRGSQSLSRGSGMSFVRDYNNGESYVVVGLAAGEDQANIRITGVRNGTHKDAVTGNIINSPNSTLSFDVKGKSAGIYVLNGPGKIGVDEVYLR